MLLLPLYRTFIVNILQYFKVFIDFQNNTITIRHTVTSCNLDGKHIQIAQDTTKTKSSMRTLPLVPAFKEKLLKLKEQQEEYKRVCGRCYNKKYLEYICVDEMGTLISPHYLTSSFPKLLEKNNLRHIRFHDLRHSCASLLLANGVPMKQIQEWLGHSDFSTTANVYAHLDYNSKLSSADAMVNGLSGALEVISQLLRRIASHKDTPTTYPEFKSRRELTEKSFQSGEKEKACKR